MSSSISIAQKAAIDLAIATNSVSVTVSRTQFTPSGGGKAKNTSSIQAQPLLLYPRLQKAREIREDGGSKDTTDWLALAPSTADFKWGEDVDDTFTVTGLGSFEVISGRAISVDTDVNGYVLDLRRLGNE